MAAENLPLSGGRGGAIACVSILWNGLDGKLSCSGAPPLAWRIRYVIAPGRGFHLSEAGRSGGLLDKQSYQEGTPTKREVPRSRRPRTAVVSSLP